MLSAQGRRSICRRSREIIGLVGCMYIESIDYEYANSVLLVKILQCSGSANERTLMRNAVSSTFQQNAETSAYSILRAVRPRA
jgi:hypothetical protein